MRKIFEKVGSRQMNPDQLGDLVTARLCAGFGFMPDAVNEVWTASSGITVLSRFLKAETHCLVGFEGLGQGREYVQNHGVSAHWRGHVMRWHGQNRCFHGFVHKGGSLML